MARAVGAEQRKLEVVEGGRPAPVDLDALLGELRGELAELRERGDRDPFGNPIKLLARTLARRLARGELDDATVERLVRRLTLNAARARAERLRRYVGELDEAANEAGIEALVRALAQGPDGALIPFEAFQAAVERPRYGFVFTAHPTFSLAAELQRQLAALVEGRDVDAALEALGAAPHRPDAPIDLAYEHGRSLEAIAHLDAALERAHGVVLDVAAELYPERWTGLVPRLVTIASWVGYDTDGRSDIAWTTTFAKRLRVKIVALERCRERVLKLRGTAGADPALGSVLELIEARLTLAMRSAGEEAAVFDGTSAQGVVRHEDLAAISRKMVETASSRLVDPHEIVRLVERAMGLTGDLAVLRDLVLLRSRIANLGLAAAHSHLRINAIQLHNAIRHSLGMDHAADDPSFRRSYMQAITEKIAQASPVEINFGTVHDERATARRVFMTIAQMLKLVDSSEPIRFLIAECETAFTLLTALYFARLFGIADKIDISPLFETRTALERGVTIIAEALAVPAYRDYVRKRGRLCVQTGFSDAGRYLGQLAAAVAIERLRLGLAPVMREAGLEGIELVVFDTHGDSIGRGGHPQSMVDRLRYLDTPESRRRFHAHGLEVKEETSFQGGDGYQYFLTERSAFAVLTRAVEHLLAPPGEADDPFYADDAYGDEFLATVERFNAEIIEDPCYAAMLGAFGTNLLYPTGSRPTRRQSDAPLGKTPLDHPSQIRAIPHNSILQQLGFLANTIGGLGQAVGKNPERFQELYRESPRFRRLMTMAEHAFMFTDLEVVRAYLDLFDPAFWIQAAAVSRDAARHEETRAVADHVERIGLASRLDRILRVLSRDHLDLAAALRRHRRLTRDQGDEPIAVDPETRDTMHLLHALRLALIERIMRRAIHIPDFSDRHATTHAGLVCAVMQLEVEPAIRLLGQIFPLVEGEQPALDYGEPSTYRDGGAQSYAHEHQTIFRPIAADYDLVRRIGTALIHHVGAIG